MQVKQILKIKIHKCRSDVNIQATNPNQSSTKIQNPQITFDSQRSSFQLRSENKTILANAGADMNQPSV